MLLLLDEVTNAMHSAANETVKWISSGNERQNNSTPARAPSVSLDVHAPAITGERIPEMRRTSVVVVVRPVVLGMGEVWRRVRTSDGVPHVTPASRRRSVAVLHSAWWALVVQRVINGLARRAHPPTQVPSSKWDYFKQDAQGYAKKESQWQLGSW